MSDCVFCRIAAGEIPAQIVAREPDALAFHDLNPQAPVHLLVIPTAHVANAADADGATLGAVMGLANRIAGDLGLQASGYRLVTNVGADGGQTVHHLHIHLLGGRQMHWPPG